MTTTQTMAETYDQIRTACAPSGTQLIAVVKRQPLERIVQAYELGIRDFGHSYVQEAQACREALADKMPEARWHFIGRIQSNKTRNLQSGWHRVHGVDRIKIARRLGDAEVLLQVRLGGEHSKAGVTPGALRPLIDAIHKDSQVQLRGLMALPPPLALWQGHDYFRDLAELRDALQSEGLLAPEAGELSMGTSQDFGQAITAGAHWIRVGTALMGTRLG